MKHCVLVLLFTVLSLPALGQNRQVGPAVSGKVVDRISGHSVGLASMWSYEEGKPRVLKVSYAKPDGSIVWQAPRAGSYKLVFRADGYMVDSLVVVMRADTTLGTIGLYPDLNTPTYQLEEAGVTAERPLLAQLVDRYVYDVSRDPEAKRKKMTEIIEKIPGLNGNNPTGQLEYNGERIVQIFIDGEQHEMINSRLQFPMRMIRADVMSKIEIIPAGSPQYNNDKPILNIVTARMLPNGYALEVSGDVSTEQIYNGKLDFVSKIRDVAIVSFGYTPAYSDRPKLHNYGTRELFNASGTTGFQQSEGVSDGYSRSHGFRFGTSFKILGNTLSLNANTSLGESGNSNRFATAFLDAASVEHSHQTTESRNTNKIAPRLGLGAGYGIVLPNKYRLGFSYTYSDSYAEGDNSSFIHHSPANEQSGRHSQTTTGAKEHAVRISLNPPTGRGIPKHRLWGNLQFGLRQYDNLADYYLWDDAAGEYGRDVDRNNGLSYTQRIANANVSYAFNTMGKLSASLVLTGGYESNQGTFFNPTPSALDYGYVQINPHTNTVWTPNRNFSMSFRYIKGTVRPGIDKLNPYIDDSDPLNLRTGNPHLRPENSHTFALRPTLRFSKSKIVMGPEIRYAIITHAIEQITEVSEDGIGLTTYFNLGKRTGLDVGMPISLFTKRFSLFFRPSYQQVTYNSSNPDVGTNTVRNLCFDSNITISPWKGSSVSLYYGLRPGITSAQSTKVNYYHNINFDWQQTIVKNKFFATFSLSNPFESRRYISNTISGSGFLYTDRREQLGRVFKLTLRANFGRFKDKIAEQGDIFQDRERPDGQK